MGATFQANSSTNVKTCTLDADCYPASTANPVFAVATTDAEKKIRCCMSMGYTTAPANSGSIFFDLSALYLAGMNTYYGMPITSTGTYTKVCSLNYPADMPYLVDILGLKITGSSRSGDTWTVPAANGSWASTQYCDGSATALAVAGTAVAAIATSMY